MLFHRPQARCQTFPFESAFGNGVLVTLQPGKFEVTITEPSGNFDVAEIGDCNGNIAEGQHLTCTFTNTERP
jgi:hypothetical protein